MSIHSQRSSFRFLTRLLAPLTLSLSLLTPSVNAENLSCATLPELFRAYLMSHYSVHNLTDDLKSHTVEQFIRYLDPSKSALLEEDVTTIRKELMGLFNTMRSGNCAALDKTQKILLKRTEEVENVVKAYLGPKYKLDESIEIITDTKKRNYAKTVEERNELTKKFVHFQIANYLLSDMKLDEAKQKLIHRYELNTKRVREKKEDDLLNAYADSFAEALDPHSSFFSKDQLDEFRIEMSLSLEGIGASLSFQDGYTVVEEIIPGGAADRAKVLQPKDKIIAVAQDKESPIPVIDMDLKDVVKLIRGKKGTKVRLTLLRMGEKTERLDVTIVRDKISMKEQEAKLKVSSKKVDGKTLHLGIIDLPSFYGEGEKGKNCYTDVKKLVAQANKKKLDGLVLNLSSNGGGLLDSAVKMSGLFIKQGGIVATKNTRERVEVLEDEDPAVQWNRPLIVLTSRASASASEILAGALRDYHRAVIVGGDHTFGKGTVQAVVPLPRDLGAMKVTTGMFFLPGGESTQHQGVKADIALPSVLSTDDMGEKSLDYSLPPQKIKSFVSEDANTDKARHWTPISETVVHSLSQKSQARVTGSKKFAEIKKDIEEAEKNKGILRLAEVLKKSKKEKKSEKEKNFRVKIQEAQAPYLEESLNILADLIHLEEPGSIPTIGEARSAQKSL